MGRILKSPISIARLWRGSVGLAGSSSLPMSMARPRCLVIQGDDSPIFPSPHLGRGVGEGQILTSPPSPFSSPSLEGEEAERTLRVSPRQ